MNRILLAAGLVVIPLATISAANAVESQRRDPPNSDLALIQKAIKVIEEDFVHHIGPDKLAREAVKGMLARLDPHSEFMSEQEVQDAAADSSGEFAGLGIEFSEENGVPTVISPIQGTPAASAGLKSGDAILSIDGKSTRGMDFGRALGGKPGTQVTLSVSRGSKAAFNIRLTRRLIQVDTVKSDLKPNDIGYVRITEFGSATPKELTQAVQKLVQQTGGRPKGIVLDLRNDGGGLLSSAVSVASDFLEGGTVVTVRGRRSGDDRTLQASDSGTLLPHTPMVVLINGASASASEIVAGALQDRHRAMIMGTQSFGKGSLQAIIPIGRYGALRLTTAFYYTPSGRSIQGLGISPDIVVAASKDGSVIADFPPESTLPGALQNPGPLQASATHDDEGETPRPGEAMTWPAIQSRFIGTSEDAQLIAALAYLGRDIIVTQNADSGGK